MQVVVSGVLGSLGASVAEALLAQGHGVVGLDRRSARQRALKAYRLNQLQRWPRFDLHQASLSPSQELPEPCRGSHAFLHFAGSSPGGATQQDFQASNVASTEAALAGAQQAGIGRFILASSAAVYAPDLPCPLTEAATLTQASTDYGRSKAAAEEAIRRASRQGMEAASLRFFNVYGPGGRPDLVLFRFIQAVQSGLPVALTQGGRHLRDFIFIDDAARAAALLAITPRWPRVDALNVGTGQPASTRDLLTAVEQAVGKTATVKEVPAVPGEILESWADISLIRRTLHWEPEMTLKKGIAATVSWFRQHEELFASPGV